jgi:cobyrinic acid a,c-diamide synthase
MSLRRVAATAPELHVAAGADADGDRHGARSRGPNQNQGADQPLTQSPSLNPEQNQAPSVPTGSPRIGILRDAAFCFYYPENLAALEAAGATLVPVSPLNDRELPPLDGLYAGGGYPEQFVDTLSRNTGFRSALAERIRRGLPVWAECGGLMYLSSAIVRDGIKRPMVGVLPFFTEHTDRPQAHGYVQATVDAPNPFLPVGTRLRGHEFHHSRVIEEPGATFETALTLERGTGLGQKRDGVLVHRVFASYLHLFAPGNPAWAKAFVRVAREVHSGLPTVVTESDRGDNNGNHSSERSQHRSRRGWVHSGA